LQLQRNNYIVRARTLDRWRDFLRVSAGPMEPRRLLMVLMPDAVENPRQPADLLRE
jgi:hypothetical protein